MTRHTLIPAAAVSVLFLISSPALCLTESSDKRLLSKSSPLTDNQKRVSDLYDRGNRLLDARRYSEAERSFLDALKLTPDIPAIHHGLGLVYVQTQDYELAVLHFCEALKRNPDQVKTLYSLAKAYASIGESEQAKEGYKKVIKLEPRLEVAYQDLAGIYYKEKKWDTALDYLSQAKAINPKSPHTLMLIGVTGNRAGRQDIALESVTELRAIRQMNEARKLEYLIYAEKNDPKPAS